MIEFYFAVFLLTLLMPKTAAADSRTSTASTGDESPVLGDTLSSTSTDGAAEVVGTGVEVGVAGVSS